MCTYTSVSSGSGGSGGGDGGGSGGYGVDSIYSNKRTRKQKVPKRGPGVAELEKILREQEKKKNIGLDHHKTNTNDHHEGSSLEVSQLSSSISCHAHSLPPPPPSPVLRSLPKKVPFAPDPNGFSPPRNNNTSTAGSLCRSGGNGSGGSNILVLPEHAFNSPTTWNSYGPSKVIDIGGPRFASAGIPFSMLSSNGPSQIFPSPTLAQRSQFSPTSMISNFPQSPVASSPCSTLIPSSAGMCHGIEPPSNQTSYHHHHHTSVLPEENKMVCRKRSCPFSMEIPPTPFHYQVPAFSPQGSRQDSSFPPGSHNPVYNLERIEAVSRDLKVDCKCNIVDYGEANSNFLLFGSPTFPSPAISTHISHRDQRSKFSHPTSFQENMEESFHRAGIGNGSICNKPFFSFLVPLEQMSKVETTYSLNNNRVETRGDGIDLDLRL